jgi:hypothetical protein
MAMRFEDMKNMSVGKVVTTAGLEGGAVVGGLFGSGLVGKISENLVKKGVVPASPMSDKVLAYVANNLPKVGVWYFFRSQSEGPKGMLKDYEPYAKDVAKGAIGSLVLDTVVRLGNNYAPRTLFTIYGYDVLGNQASGNNNVTPEMQQNMQKVLQENSSLRNQLNSALQRVASASPNVTVTPMTQVRNVAPQIPAPTPVSDRAYGVMPTRGNPRYGTMPVDETPSQRNFGQMNANDMSIDGGAKTLGSMFNFD